VVVVKAAVETVDGLFVELICKLTAFILLSCSKDR